MSVLSDLTLKVKLVGGVIIFVLFVALLGSIYGWYREMNKPVTSTVRYVDVEKIKEVEKIKKVNVPGPKEIITIEKKVLVEKEKLPDWFVSDKNEQAIATGVVPPYKGDTNVIATLNTETGKGNLVTRQVPLSFLRFENERQFYGKIGYSTNSEIQVTLGGQYKFAGIGNIDVGLFVEGRGYFENGTQNTGSRDNAEVIGGLIFTY